MTPDKLGIYIFAESVDPTMAKLAFNVLSEEVPTITKLKHIVRSTEVSKCYNQNKNYDKVVMAQEDRHCTTCNSKTHNTSECWGPCSYCGRYNHRSEKCFHKIVPIQESSERANKAQNTKKKQKKKKKAEKASE